MTLSIDLQTRAPYDSALLQTLNSDAKLTRKDIEHVMGASQDGTCRDRRIRCVGRRVAATNVMELMEPLVHSSCPSAPTHRCLCFRETDPFGRCKGLLACYSLRHSVLGAASLQGSREPRPTSRALLQRSLSPIEISAWSFNFSIAAKNQEPLAPLWSW
jgi:hypothetical protein